MCEIAKSETVPNVAVRAFAAVANAASERVALDAKIKETEDKIQACVSKREFKELTSLEAQKTEFQRQKRDMELCDSKEASVAGAVCGLMNASDDSVSVKIAEID